jgi:phage terminase small subunit
MALTFEELKLKLMQVDEISLMELLEISSEDLVERFEDKIDARLDGLMEEFDSREDSDETEET